MVAWIINPWKGIQIISRVEPKRWLGEDGFGGVDLGISENRMVYQSHGPVEPIISDDSLDLFGRLYTYIYAPSGYKSSGLDDIWWDMISSYINIYHPNLRISTVNYNDLTATSLESWLVRGIKTKLPYFRLVNYFNLPRYMIVFIRCWSLIHPQG